MDKQMKKAFLITTLCLLILVGYGQSRPQTTRLKKIVESIHENLRDVATMSGIPYLSSAHWAKVVYIQSPDTLIAVPFDSLGNGYNYLDYDIKIVFDKQTQIKTQFLQGIIVLEPIGEERIEKYKTYYMDIKRRKGSN